MPLYKTVNHTDDFVPLNAENSYQLVRCNKGRQNPWSLVTSPSKNAQIWHYYDIYWFQIEPEIVNSVAFTIRIGSVTYIFQWCEDT